MRIEPPQDDAPTDEDADLLVVEHHELPRLTFRIDPAALREAFERWERERAS